MGTASTYLSILSLPSLAAQSRRCHHCESVLPAGPQSMPVPPWTEPHRPGTSAHLTLAPLPRVHYIYICLNPTCWKLPAWWQDGAHCQRLARYCAFGRKQASSAPMLSPLHNHAGPGFPRSWAKQHAGFVLAKPVSDRPILQGYKLIHTAADSSSRRGHPTVQACQDHAHVQKPVSHSLHVYRGKSWLFVILLCALQV